jgi:hypothetical protein
MLQGSMMYGFLIWDLPKKWIPSGGKMDVVQATFS